MSRSFALALVMAGILMVAPGAVIKPFLADAAYAQDKKSDAKSGQGEKKTKKRKRRRKRRTLVQVDKVRMEPLVQTTPVIGRLVAVRAGVVAARIDAPVADMKVDVGDHVKKGDVLATLVNDIIKWDRAQKAAEVTVSQAQINTAKARLTLARQELKRITDLRTSAAFSKARYQDKQVEVTRYRAELAEAEAKLKRANASLQLADTELRYTQIRAPYSGTITQRHTESGAFIKEGQAVYTMVSDQNMEIEADVPMRRISGLKAGTKVTFELIRGTKLDAEVRAVVPEENLRTRTRTARFRPLLKTRPENIAANQSATVFIPIGKQRMVLSMHKDALISSRGKPTVFVIEEGRAHAREVRIGEGVGGRFEVLSGLKEGELVVVRGNERLKDRRRVRVDGATN